MDHYKKMFDNQVMVVDIDIVIVFRMFIFIMSLDIAMILIVLSLPNNFSRWGLRQSTCVIWNILLNQY